MYFSDDHTIVEPLNVPEDEKPGSRIVVEGFSGEPDAQLNPKKKVKLRVYVYCYLCSVSNSFFSI